MLGISPHRRATAPKHSPAAVAAMIRWMKRGFPIVTEEILAERKSTCATCEWWEPKGFFHTGQCRKCGCSTAAKLAIPTEACPVGKWPSLDLS